MPGILVKIRDGSGKNTIRFINGVMQIIRSIQNRIYEIGGERIMLDFDLAQLYEVETKAVNQAVKRNIKRFPRDFMFRLTIAEWQAIRSQAVTASDSTNMRSQIVTASQAKRKREQPWRKIGDR